ncbi:hypothetical protein RchiOBHm_Chr2g0152861 [Rosa chinensis]|uniref:Uncharacterized protein n=1 Tax=Rosa chinensis TaxID=74649 RepID=A0A2P6S0I6_ROSCH|nr:hypothetical protein RchiOBHm_Chr2g0152861 [Rosa chinensis]
MGIMKYVARLLNWEFLLFEKCQDSVLSDRFETFGSNDRWSEDVRVTVGSGHQYVLGLKGKKFLSILY